MVRRCQFATSEDITFLEDQIALRARARADTEVRKATSFGVLTHAAS